MTSIAPAIDKKIAIVHDALVVPGGTEKVVLHLSRIFPQAPIYTSVYLPGNTFPDFCEKKVVALPSFFRVKNERQFKALFPWWYLGFTRLDLSGFDLVISSANYLAKFIRPPGNTAHVSYIQNPFRFLWKPETYSPSSLPYSRPVIAAIRLLFPLLRSMDVRATRRIKNVVANSRNMGNQIEKVYGLKAEIIYPPVDVDQFELSTGPGDYYLCAGRLISHKRVDLAIQACNLLHRKLLIAGDGLERPRLEQLGGEDVRILGRVSDARLKQLYANCRGLIFPSDEDFGMVPVEAQASGRPVIAYRSGGALETVIEFETGIFFSEQNVDSLAEAMVRFEGLEFDPQRIRQNAMQFDHHQFENKFRDYVVRKTGITQLEN
jgi:glycosyltransferase involved in cell wall biosynthesis